MARKEKEKQINFTISEEEKAELIEFCAATGLSLNAAMRKAKALLLLDDVKSRVPNMSASIEDFEVHVYALLALYKASIEHGIIADERASKNVKSKLDAIDKLVEDLREAQDEKKRLEKENALLKKENEMFQTAVSFEKFEAVKLENIELREELSKIREQHSKEIEKIRNEQWKKIMEVISAKP